MKDRTLYYKDQKATPLPFSVTFNWEGRYLTVALKNGEDVFKLSDMFIKALADNGIEYNVTEKKYESNT